jgi:hypothetical protein
MTSGTGLREVHTRRPKDIEAAKGNLRAPSLHTAYEDGPARYNAVTAARLPEEADRPTIAAKVGSR